MSGLILSSDQSRALKAVRDWRARGTKQVFKLAGYAGCGKTTLLGVFAAELPPTLVAYATFTGRASSILQRKLNATGVKTTNKSRPARAETANPKYHDISLPKSRGPAFVGTLHRLLYAPIIDDDTEELKGWRKRVELDREYALIVIDEASMVGDEMLADIQSHGIPILAVGDHGQLPPVSDSGSLMEEPDVKLEKIHRQAKGNPIIQLAHTVRNHGFLDDDLADGKHVVFADKRNARKVIRKAYEAAVIDGQRGIVGSPLDVGMLCWMNRTRISLNAEARDALGHRDSPRQGELVICLKNDPPIYNGMRGVLAKNAEADAMSPWLLYAAVGFPEEGLEPAVLKMCGATFNRERPFESIEALQAAGIDVGRFSDAGAPYDFGYALTVHKCVHPETLVETAKGLVAARDLDKKGFVATPYGVAPYRGLVHNPVGHMLEIVTRDGYSLRVTHDHGVDVYDPEIDDYTRKAAKYVKPGDMVRLRLGAAFPQTRDEPLPAEPKDLDVRTRRFHVPKNVSFELAEFLGLMVADGTLYRRGFRIAKRHQDVADRFDSLCRLLFGVRPSRFFKLGAHHVEVSSAYVADWLRLLGGLTPKRKDVPACILRSDRRYQESFLRGLSEDGTVNTKRGMLDHVEWSSAYEPLRRKVRVMLLRSGIISGCTPRRPECVYIYGVHAKRFGDRIGFVAKSKNARLELPTGEERRYVVPSLLGNPSNIGDSKIRRVSRQRARELGLSKELLRFHHSFVREVRKITPSESVCIEVPSGHQFIQDGFCGWNSQGSEFDHAIFYLDRQLKRDDEESRRFFYTAITRARSKLTVLV